MNAYIDRTFSPKQYGDTREARDQATRQRKRQKQDTQHDKRMDKNDTKATFFPDERKCTSHHTLYYLPWAAYDAMCRCRRCRRRRRHLSHGGLLLFDGLATRVAFYIRPEIRRVSTANMLYFVHERESLRSHPCLPSLHRHRSPPIRK